MEEVRYILNGKRYILFRFDEYPKYKLKGEDGTTMVIEDENELTEFLLGLVNLKKITNN